MTPNYTLPEGNMTVNTNSFPPNTTHAVTHETPGGPSQLYNILKTLFFSFVIVVGLVGNSLVVANLCRWREMRTPCNLLIANICAADLGVCVLAAPLRIIEIYRGWLFGDVLCYILAPLQDVFVVVSVVTHTVIAMERHRAVVTPFKPKVTVKRVKMAVPVIWIACYVTSGVPILILILLRNKLLPNGHFVCRARFSSASYRIAYEMYLVVFFITLPLVLQSVAYFSVIRALIRAKNEIQSMCNAQQQNSSMQKTFSDRARQKKHLVRMLIVLMLVFQVCYLPRGVLMLIPELSPETTAQPEFLYVELITLAMYYLKHVVNPIILIAMSKDFRSGCLCLG
ncbi:prolactin-releasing peptide receptor-like [Oculina patagonica]